MLQRATIYVYLRDGSDIERTRNIAESLDMICECHDGDITRAIVDASNWRIPPNFLVVEMPQDGSVMKAVELLAEAAPDGNTYLILVGADNNVRLYRDLKAMGVSDYIIKPIEEDEFRSVLLEIGDRRHAEMRYPPERVAVFAGARGGVGSSTLAAMAAYHSASTLARRTLLIDCDIQLGVQDILFNLDNNGRPTSNYVSMIENPDRIDGTVIERSMDRVEKPKGLNILSVSRPSESAVYDTEAIERIISSTHSSMESYIIDAPARNPFGFQLLMKAGLVFIVTSLDLAGARDAIAMKHFLMQHNFSGEIRLVANRKGFLKVGELSLEEMKKKIGIPATALPYDPRSPGQALISGRSVLDFPGPLSKAFLENIAPFLPHGVPPARKSLMSKILGD